MKPIKSKRTAIEDSMNNLILLHTKLIDATNLLGALKHYKANEDVIDFVAGNIKNLWTSFKAITGSEDLEKEIKEEIKNKVEDDNPE